LVIAVGNEAEKSWFGKFNDSRTGFTKFPNGSEFLDVYLPINSKIHLIWNDFKNRNTAYDMYIFDNNDVLVWSSSFTANGINLPHIEYVKFVKAAIGRVILWK
jgi:hypothetical protein